jgi:hypothetical protein
MPITGRATITLDTTSPLLTVHSHHSGDSITGTTLTLTGLLIDDNIANVHINGQTGTFTPLSLSGDYQRTHTLPLTGGETLLNIQAIDLAGNRSET